MDVDQEKQHGALRSSHCEFFLHTDDKLLDVGYSVLLKREDWRLGKDIEADSVAYIM